MAQVLTARPISEPADSGKESYEITWIIPNWRDVRKSRKLVQNQEAIFETGVSPVSWLKTKWLVGLKLVRTGDFRKARVYWKLLDINGPKSCTKLDVTLKMQLLRGDSSLSTFTDEKSQEVKLLETVENRSGCLEINPVSPYIDWQLVSSNGEVTFLLKLTLALPLMSDLERDQYQMEQFSRTSAERLRQNHAALLNDDPGNADLKIISSDQVEISAHRTILRAQCPVFAAMFNCDLSENASGVIQMTDVSGKTMKILLHYWYVGELLPSWSDPDTIVEFTYAAGKYQMTEVLKLLDDMLGKTSGTVTSNLDVQLLDLAGKLKLEKAEGRLLKRVVFEIKKAKSSWEMFELFGYEHEEE